MWINPNLTLLQYYHRRLSGRDLYYFNNEGEDVATTVRLRNAHGVPELWEPVSGEIRQAPCYSQAHNELSLWLHLRRYESVFVVVSPSATPLKHLIESTADEVLRGADGGIILRKYGPGVLRYQVVQPEGAMASREIRTPASPVSPQPLEGGWSRTPVEPNGAAYRIRFDWTNTTARSAVLAIEDMTQVLHVKLNGRDLGMRFAYPFRFDLGDALKRGSNELEITHVERHTFTSKLGKIRLEPYYELRV